MHLFTYSLLVNVKRVYRKLWSRRVLWTNCVYGIGGTPVTRSNSLGRALVTVAVWHDVAMVLSSCRNSRELCRADGLYGNSVALYRICIGDSAGSHSPHRELKVGQLWGKRGEAQRGEERSGGERPGKADGHVCARTRTRTRPLGKAQSRGEIRKRLMRAQIHAQGPLQ